MPVSDAISGQALDQIDQLPHRNSSGDINRRNDQWHLENPHNKALAALVYASLLRGAWEIVAHCGGPLFRRRACNPHALPVSASGNRHVDVS
jgi:hypothetical protein